MTLVPVLIIVAILAAVGALGFGTVSSVSKRQVEEEVTALLRGIPQHGVTLGSPRAPLTVQVFADLECPTVKGLVVTYLPGIIDRWVRSGIAKLEYRSLETDTLNEQTFFRQEIAALAAGRQDRMWNFVLTFVREQESEYTGYATEPFLTGIATQVPGLDRRRWREAREDARLSQRVALSMQAARARSFGSTPSLVVNSARGKAGVPVLSGDLPAMEDELVTSLEADLQSLKKEVSQDAPALKREEFAERKEVRELTER